jgi:CheY-like chemotaxis protein
MPSPRARPPRHATSFDATEPVDWGQDAQNSVPNYDAVIAAIAAGDLAAAPDQTGRKRVLVVDGDVSARLYLRAKLSLMDNIDVYEAASGDEAVQISQLTPFDGVLLDSHLEGLSGYAVCRGIQRQSRKLGHKPPKIYFVTSRSGMLHRLRARMAGADAFLSKPPHPARLAELLGSL